MWVLSQLHHKNIVTLYGLCVAPMGILTEWIAYGNLYHWLHDHSLDWYLRIKIALDIAEGMVSFVPSSLQQSIHPSIYSFILDISELTYRLPIFP